MLTIDGARIVVRVHDRPNGGRSYLAPINVHAEYSTVLDLAKVSHLHGLLPYMIDKSSD